MNPLPYFPFYANDWLTGQATTRMTPEQKGAFIDLLAHAWNSKPPCTLLDDDVVFAKLSGLGPRWRRVGALVRAQFVPAGEGLVMNPKQMEIFQGVANSREDHQINGAKGAAARWGPKLKSQSVAIASPLARPVVAPIASGSRAGREPMASSDHRSQILERIPSLAPVESEEVGAQVATFLERYPVVYAKVRHGARYLVKPARDYHYALQLVTNWPDLSRLELMAEVFLRMSPKEANNIPGTPGQFLHMAPECDSRLREHGK